MNVSEFLRLYPMRAPNIMWLLGAGASAAAGISTAYHMIWEFKRTIYCSTQRVPLGACSDLSNPLIRSRIQGHFNSLPGAPVADSAEEYSYYFQQAYPNEGDRRRYIDQIVSSAVPSFGHLALAGLLKMDKARVVWTTNFDRMIEDSAARIFGSSSRLVVGSIDAPYLVTDAFNAGRWPMCAKLHGDFHSRRLKNTSDELRAQDEELRSCLLTACRSQGLAIIGYSGRDASVMDTLDEAVASGRGCPAGLFWFHRPESDCLPRVTTLINNASARGIDAHLIDVETFDELMADVLSLMPDIPAEVSQLLDNRPRRVSNAPLPTSAGSWPILRTNAFPILSAPSTCRRVVCDIRGQKAVREALSKAGADIVAGRRNVGVIAFGEDSMIRKVFEPFNISEFSVHSIENRRLRYESAELGLLYDALCRALARNCPLLVHRRGRRALVAVDQAQLPNSRYSKLRSTFSSLIGTIPGTDVRWAEAARIRLEFRIERLWLVVEPTVWVDEIEDRVQRDNAKAFVRERLACRYNTTWSKMLDGWAEVLLGDSDSAELLAFGTPNGTDAMFRISRVTGFSWRGGVR